MLRSIVRCTRALSRSRLFQGRFSRTAAKCKFFESLEERWLLAANLVTHYDASAITPVADGTAIAQWNDISGNANHANQQAGAATYLSNGVGGEPSLQLDTSDGYRSALSLGTLAGIQGDAGWSMIFVTRVQGGPHVAGMGDGNFFNGAAFLELEPTGLGTRIDLAGGWGHDVVVNPGNSFNPFFQQDIIVTITHAGNTAQSMLDTIEIFVNGDAPGEGALAGFTLGTTGNAATTPLNLFDRPVTIGRYNGMGVVGMTGLIAEIRVYDDALSEQEREAVELSLKQKYGMVPGALPPSIDALTASPNPVRQGANLTLTAAGVSDPDGTVDSVNFYWDSNGNSVLDLGSDALFGTDTDDADGWTVDAPVTGIPAGSQIFFAQAEDATNLTSNIVATTVQVDSTVYWDGGAGDLQWSSAANWSTNTLPGAANVVVINVAGDVTISHSSGNSILAGLENYESLTISGGAMTVTGPSFVDGTLTLAAGTTLTASGSMATFIANGATTLNGANLFAFGGGQLSLPSAASYSGLNAGRTIQASGAGSRIDLSGITSFSGSTGAPCGNCAPFETTVSAASGGIVDLTATTTMTNSVGVVVSGAGSLADLAVLGSKTGGRMVINDNLGSINAPTLGSIAANTLQAFGGGLLDLSSVTNYSGGSQGNTVSASGAGSRIDLSGTVTFAGSTGASCGNCAPFETTVSGAAGGIVDLTATTTMTNNVGIVVSGAGSLVDLAVLGSKTGGRMVINDNLGSINAPTLGSIAANTLQAFGGGLLDLSSVTNYSGGSQGNTVSASGAGSRIDLSGTVTFAGSTGASCGNCAPFETTVSAASGGVVDLTATTTMTNSVGVVVSGAGSLVDLAVLGSKTGGRMVINDNLGSINAPTLGSIAANTLQAFGGGVLDLSSVTNYSGGSQGNTVSASGAGSRIDLSGTVTFAGSSGASCGNCAPFETTVSAVSGGVVDLTAATTMTNNVGVVVSGAGSLVDLAVLGSKTGGRMVINDNLGSINAPTLGSIAANTLQTFGGGVLDLSSVTNYSGGLQGNTVSASGAGSRIDLSGTVTFSGSTGASCGNCAPFETTVSAAAGGVVDLTATTTMTNNAGVVVSGAGSLVDLAVLGSKTGGRMVINDNLGSINAPTLGSIAANTLQAFGGGVLDLSSVTNYSGGFQGNSLRASGAGSQINLSGVWTLEGSQGASCGNCAPFQTVIHADNNGEVQLGNSTVHLSRTLLLNADSGIIRGTVLRVTPGTDIPIVGLVHASITNEGVVRLHNSPDRLAIVGDYVQTADAHLRVNLGGVAPESHFDQVTVTGRATLDGTLDVSLINGFVPANGNAFEILTFDSRLCDFHTKTGVNLGGGSHLAASFTDTAMRLNAGSTPDSGQQCLTVPEFTNISVGPDPAKAGDPLSITFEVDVALQTNPTVTVDGDPAAFVSQNGSVFTYTYTVSGDENEGLVDVAMTGTAALDGGVGSETVQVVLDFTDPAVSNITASPNPVGSGQALNTTFTASELLSPSTVVTVGGLQANLSQVNGLTYTYTRVISGGEGIGSVAIEIDAVDLAGNTSNTTGSIVIFSGGLGVRADDIELSDDTPQVGETVFASITIENSGLFAATNVPVQVTLFESNGPRNLGTFMLPSIAGNNNAVLSLDFDVQTTGVHVIAVQVDPAGAILEDSEGDNIATRSLLVGEILGEVINVESSLSANSGVPGSPVTVIGTATYNATLNAAGPAARVPVTVRIPSVNFADTTITDVNGSFSLDFNMPVLPGNYVAEVRASDVTAAGVDILPFTVTQPPAGFDLFTNASQISFSASSPVIGQSLTISARVFNVGGNHFAGTAEVQFLEGNTLLGSATVSNLASGASTIVSIPHTFTTTGNHTITVLVDPVDQFIELNENNNAGARSVSVLDTLPDLAPIDIVFSDLTPSTVQSITLTATVQNFGGAAANNVQVHFFDDGNPLGSGVISSLAAGGGTGGLSVQVVIDTAGTHTITVVVDPNNEMVELNESNNSYSETVQVHEPAADLAPSVISLSNPAPLANEAVDASVTVRNQGEIATSSFDVQFLQDGNPLGVVTVSSLAVDGTAIVSLPLSFATAGVHNVSVVVNSTNIVVELSESNNVSTLDVQVLATPLSDLTIHKNDFSLSDPNPDGNELVTVTVPVFNVGASLATGVSAELRIDGAVIATTTTTPADIGVGGNATASFDFLAPPADGFHLLEMVIDPGNAIGESNENNNRDFIFFLVGDHPDLVPFQIAFSNNAPAEGEVVTVSATVHNDGDLVAESFLVRFLDGSQQIGQVVVAGLNVGENQVVSVPFDTAGRSGNRLIQVIADPDNQIAEANEGNNLVSIILNVAGDLVPPATTATFSTPPNASGWNDSDVDLTLVAADNVGGSGLALITYSIDGGPAASVFGDTVTIPFTDEGIYTVTYHAVDVNQNAETVQSVQVRIDRTAPTAVHGGPFTVLEGSTIQLDGGNSSDALSGIASTAWDLDSNDAFDDGDPATYTGIDGPTTQLVSLRVTDLAGNQSVVVTEVQVLNVSPTSVAGGSYSVDEGSSVQLNGSGSSDPGNDIAAFEWDFDYDGTMFDVDATGITPTFDATGLQGPLTRNVALRVSDSAGASDLATTSVQIIPVNIGPIVVEPGDRGGLISGGSGLMDRVQIVVSLTEAISSSVEMDFDAYQTHLDNGNAAVPFTLNSLGVSLVGFEHFDRLLEHGTFRGIYVNPVVGTNSSQTLTGSTDSDLIVGLGGNDTLVGSSGNDILIGGPGNDTFDGGGGDDVFLYVANNNGFDTYDGGEGFDSAIAIGAASTIGVNGYSGGIERFEGPGDSIILDSNSSHILDFSGTELIGIALIDAAGGNDAVTASNGSDGVYQGGAGNDSLIAGDSLAVWLYDGTNNGFDTLYNGAGMSVARALSDGTTFGVDGYTNGVDVFDGNCHSGVAIRDTNSSRVLDFSQTTLEDIQEVDAAGGNDTLMGSNLSAAVYRGGAGNDTLISLIATVTWAYAGTNNGYDTFVNGTGDSFAKAESNDTIIGVDGYTNGVDALDGSGQSGVIIRDTNSSRQLDFSQTTLEDIHEVDAAGGNDTLTASDLSAAVYRGGAGNDTLISLSVTVTWAYAGTNNGYDWFVNGTGNSVAQAESSDTIIGVDGYTNGVDVFDGNGQSGVIIRDTNSSRVLDFSQTTLEDIQAVDAAGGNDTLTASDLSAAVYRGGAGNDTLIALSATVTWVYAGINNGYDMFVNGTGNSVAQAESNDTTIGVDGYANGVDAFDGNGQSGVTIRDTNSSRMLDFSETTLTGIHEIDAGGGNDTLVAARLSPGAYRGGAGNDTFVVRNSQHLVDAAILDFMQNENDKIDLRDFGFNPNLGLAGLSTREEDGDTIIALSEDESLRLVDISLASLDTDDFLF